MANTLKSATGGAASGAAAGSMLGPYGAIAGGLIGGAAGLMSSGDEPNFQNAQLSQSGQVNLDALRARSDRTLGDFAGESNEGLGGDEAHAMLGDAHSHAMTHEALGGGPSLMGEALQNRTQTRYSGDLARLKRQNDIASLDRKQALNNQVYGLDMQKAQIDTEMAAKQLIYNRAAEEARNAALSSVLGSAGNMIGTAVGSAEAGQASPNAKRGVQK